MHRSLDGYGTFVFDCDGVLLDSNRIKTEAFYEAALSYGEDAACELVRHHREHGGVSRQLKFAYFLERIVGQQPSSESAYQELLELGLPPEDARFVLPIGTKVNIVMSVNARMLMHIADMRAAADAQWEIREMTEEILDIAAEWCPITFEYYNEHMKNRKNRLAP